MNRSRARASSALALALALCANVALAARAASFSGTASFWYAGTRLSFDHAQFRGGALAVATDDAGLARFLAKLGATLAYRAAHGEIVVTRGDGAAVTLLVGDAHYGFDGTVRTAPFAPYATGGVAYLPFLELAHALGVEAVDDDTTIVLEPQLAGPDVRAGGRSTIVTFHGASPLRFRRLSENGDDTVSIAFSGIAPISEMTRTIAGPGLRAISIVASGTPKNPTTVANFVGFPGGAHALLASRSPNTFTIAFGPPGVALGGAAIPREGGFAAATVAAAPLAPAVVPASQTPAAPPSQPAVAPEMTNAPVAVGPAAPEVETTPTPTAYGLPVATITDVSTEDTGDGIRVHLKLTGDVTYEWHRLSDDRWYVDLKPATLGTTQDVTLPNSSVDSLRIKGFVGPTDRLQTVRVAFTLASPRTVGLAPEVGGLALTVGADDDTSGTRVGLGEISSGKLVASIVAPPTPAPAPDPADSPDAWKFSPAPSASGNGRLIVIDPGHGGSDTGAISKINGLVEKDLNLELSKSLRTALVARGWRVKLTRESDVDVYAPNDSAHDELQARDDIVNNSGARMLVSMHTNSFTSSSLSGTTTYYFNDASYPLATAIHARLAAALPTKDDGIRKENFYVIHHTALPAVLIETAFLSNPGDAALLAQPGFLAKIVGAIADGIGDYAAASSSLSRANASATDDR